MTERILLVEDHALFAESLAAALADLGHDVQLAEISGHAGAELVLAHAADYLPSVVLLDLDLGGMDSVPLIGPLHDCGARVVMLTAVTDRLRHAECVKAGAAGVLSKADHFAEIVEAIQQVASGRPLLDGNQRAELLRDLRAAEAAEAERLAPFARLTPAEQTVLRLLLEGRSPGDIAKERVVSLATVRTQIHRILGQLGAASQLEAVARARRAGWPPPDGPTLEP